MKKFVIGFVAAALMFFVIPAQAAKAPTYTQLKNQVASLQKQVKDLKSQLASAKSLNTQYESYLQPIVDKATEIKNENEQLRALLKESQGQTLQALDLADQYKTLYLQAVANNQTTVITPTVTPIVSQPVVTPNYKCYQGTTIECYDLNTFSSDLITKLNNIANQPIPMSSINGQQLKAIHEYLGY